MKRFKLLSVFLALIALTFTACGGGSSMSDTGNGNAQAQVFVTGEDAPVSSVVSFYITINSITLNNSSSTVTVLSQPTTVDFGRLIGLRSLLGFNTVAPGTYTSAQNVALSSATPGATIYYTVDGSTPTHSSSVYGAPIVVSSASLTIRALASASGYQDSPIVMGAYVIQAAATATPTFAPGAGTYTSSQSVTISDSTPGAVI